MKNAPILRILTVIAAVAAGVEGQISMAASTVFSTQPYQLQVVSGVPDAPVWIAFDVATAPTQVGISDVHSFAILLAATPALTVLPEQRFDKFGQVVLTMGTGTSDLTGMHFYGQAVTFDPNANRYWPTNLETIVVHPAPATSGMTTALSLGDEQGETFLPASMTFSFYGRQYGQVSVTSNGLLAFESTDPIALESSATFLGEGASVAVLWDDLDPSTGGSVQVTEDPNGSFLKVSFVGVPQFGFADANTAHVTFYPNGCLMMQYGIVSLQDAIVGVSPGSDLSSALPLDLSAAPAQQSLAGDAVYEVFTPASPFDLGSATVSFIDVGGGQYSVIFN